MQYKWIFAVSLFLFTITACKNRQEKNTGNQTVDTLQQKKEKAVIYTCPMHPQVREHAPGKCPICGMKLVPVDNPPAKDDKDTVAELTLSARQQLLAGIHTDTARMAPLQQELILNGTTLFNPKQQDVISAWVDGWIVKMYVRNPGEAISVGQKLYDLYSPELLSAEKDYLLAQEQKALFKEASVDFTATIQAMKQKLLRWGLSEKQINQLSQVQPDGKVTVHSKASGYLIEKMKEDGGYVKEGEAVLSLARNNTLWVQAELYDQELPVLTEDNKIWATLPGNAQKFAGKIVFDNPVNEPNSRVHLINIVISNPDGRIQPAMLAYVHLQTVTGQQALSIPKSAIIYGEKERYAWIALPKHTFQRRKLQLGKESQTTVEVLGGINPGERVVNSGAFLLNSEYILKYGNGVNLSGMQMSDMKMSGKTP